MPFVGCSFAPFLPILKSHDVEARHHLHALWLKPFVATSSCVPPHIQRWQAKEDERAEMEENLASAFSEIVKDLSNRVCASLHASPVHIIHSRRVCLHAAGHTVQPSKPSSPLLILQAPHSNHHHLQAGAELNSRA